MSTDKLEQDVFEVLGIKPKAEETPKTENERNFSVLIPWDRVGSVTSEGISIPTTTAPAETEAPAKVSSEEHAEVSPLEQKIDKLTSAIVKLSEVSTVTPEVAEVATEEPEAEEAEEVVEETPTEEETPTAKAPEEETNEVQDFTKGFEFRDIGRIFAMED